MRKFLLIPFILLLASCSVEISNSRVQSQEACLEWARKGKKRYYLKFELSETTPAETKSYLTKYVLGKRYSQDGWLGEQYVDPWGKTYVGIAETRWCFEEVETNQFLGYEMKVFGGDKVQKTLIKGPIKVVKNFKY